MNSYRVHFITPDYRTVKIVTVLAYGKEQAYSIAEAIHRNKWKFSYNDMWIE